jgi:hypothetical protein
MRSAPPVLVPVGRFVWGHALTLALAFIVALPLGYVWYSAGASLTQGSLWLLLWGLGGLVSWWLGLREVLPSGTLAWDGEGWHHASPALSGKVHAPLPIPVTVHVLWDAGALMLVGVHVQGKSCAHDGRWNGQRFAFLRATDMPGQWHALRCAVYANDIF